MSHLSRSFNGVFRYLRLAWRPCKNRSLAWWKNYLERSDYKSGTVISHGFTDEKVIQDFPLRGKPVYLHVRRRRWYDKATGETFSYTYDDLTAEGTKLTPEFVAFLKEEDWNYRG